MCVFFIIGFASASILLTNGDFEQTLDTGWTDQIQGGSTQDTIDRQTYFHPDGDYEVRVKKYDDAYAKLWQTVDIPTTDLEFSVYTKLYAYEYDVLGTHWITAAVVLAYLDENDSLLGQTRICRNSNRCPYTNTPTFHMIPHMDPNSWSTYSFNINDELANLPGVTPSDIARITVALFDTTDGC
jgi:hypothetical protein